MLLRVEVAKYVGGHHLGLQLLCKVLIYHWLLRVACVLLATREWALEPTLLIKAPCPALLAESILTA